MGKHAFVIAGTHSGCGKTTLALGMMAALRARGLKVQPFKVGPDFIDPGFHTQITGLTSRNLDGWMLSRGYNEAMFRRLLRGVDVAVVEGVMGVFDGYDGLSEAGSTAEMAKWLGLPVLLVVDARSMARSAAALVYGFSRFDPSLRLAGVIFNRIGGEGHLAYLKEAMAASLPEIPVLGGMLREDMVQIPERHLGLVTADEVFLSPDWRRRVVEAMEVHLDLDGILNRTASSEGSQMGLRGAEDEVRSTKSVPIAVARDAAFCFYYPDNLELLERWGGRLLFFSPLAGESVPPEASGVYLGGGYPELFAEGISSGGEFLESLRRGASKGMPIYAECGGLMVLSRFIETKAGKRYPMAGLLPFGTRMLERRKALGYTEVVLTRHCLLGETGSVVRGHEFHYSEIVEREEDPSVRCVYELSGRKHQDVRPEGYVAGSVLASYIHLHWGSAPGAGKAFVKHCAVYGEGSFPTD